MVIYIISYRRNSDFIFYLCIVPCGGSRLDLQVFSEGLAAFRLENLSGLRIGSLRRAQAPW